MFASFFYGVGMGFLVAFMAYGVRTLAGLYSNSNPFNKD